MYYVYILASKSRRLYIGITNDLGRRIVEHANNMSEFTARYRINRLVYYETFEQPMQAIKREKRLKLLLRSHKIALIESTNPAWDDLAEGWVWRPG